MPSFCRHNRLLQNCPICAREQEIELRPIVSPAGHSVSSAPRSRTSPTARPAAGPSRTGTARRMTVRRLQRGTEDGYRSPLAPGLRSGADAERLADELAFSATRLAVLASEPPGLYAEVADPGGPIEERTWLAFLIACLGPLEGEQPFAAIEQARTPWEEGALPELHAIQTGPRAARDASRAQRAIPAYRAWAARAGSQAAAFTGEASWTPERRFTRAFERLALPGLQRGQRFDLLSTLGALGAYQLRAQALHFGGEDTVTLAAKRVLGIGDPLLLERRAAELAVACELPLEALDLGFFNWERGSRAPMGMTPGLEPDAGLVDAARAGLGL